MAKQLTFDLPKAVSLAAEDYFVSAANAQAHALVMGAGPWPEGKLALIGPRGSGKSHLGRLWAGSTGAVTVLAQMIGPDDELPDAAPVLLEDADRLPRDVEEAVFHLHNRLRAARRPILVTAATPPGEWGIALPDLASRMQAAIQARIGDPDEPLLRAVIAKHFADRQLSPGPDVIEWLLPRIERSFAAADRAVSMLDSAALDRRATITRSFAREVLGTDAENVTKT